MKFNGAKVIKTREGEEMKISILSRDGQKVIKTRLRTFRSELAEILDAFKGQTKEDSIHSFRLALKLYDADEVDLSSDDIALAIKAIEHIITKTENPNNHIIGLILEALEVEEKPKK